LIELHWDRLGLLKRAPVAGARPSARSVKVSNTPLCSRLYPRESRDTPSETLFAELPQLFSANIGSRPLAPLCFFAIVDGYAEAAPRGMILGTGASSPSSCTGFTPPSRT
jgi:hypothetical protein